MDEDALAGGSENGAELGDNNVPSLQVSGSACWRGGPPPRYHRSVTLQIALPFFSVVKFMCHKTCPADVCLVGVRSALELIKHMLKQGATRTHALLFMLF